MEAFQVMNKEKNGWGNMYDSSFGLGKKKDKPKNKTIVQKIKELIIK